MLATLQVLLLGPVEARHDGQPLDVPGARLAALLARLALVPGQVVAPGTLIEALWGHEPPANATNALQSLVSRLRRVLPAGSVLSRPAGYVLDVAPEAVDAVRCERALADARRAVEAGADDDALALLVGAEALWRGAALGGLGDVPFAAAAAGALEEVRLTAAELRLGLLVRCGQAAVALPDAERLAGEHPLRESLTEVWMRALAAAGRPADALAVFERTREVLAEELGADPSPQLRALHTEVLRGEVPVPAASGPPAVVAPTAAATPEPVPFPAPPAPAVPASRLRTPVTSFVGREDDVARIHRLLGEHRLVTLLGPGGAGKTRLALETARALEQGGREVHWVELAPLTASAEEVTQLAGAVLDELRLRGVSLFDSGRTEVREDDLTRLVAALAAPALLVLDNCEHLIEAAAGLADELLARCPALTVLATSREPLAISGEALHPVTPLRLPPREPAEAAGRAAGSVEGAGVVEGAGPAVGARGAAVDGDTREDGDADGDLADVAHAPAVRLFLDRAAAAVPGFALTAETRADVVEVCRRLDGLPLAIELAAARLRTLPLPQLAGRLDQRFRLLTGGSRTAAPRHRTLRAVVEWSWDLMDDRERDVAEHLAIFPAGATPDAVHAVLRAGRPVADWSGEAVEDVQDVLLVLADKSIVRAAAPDSRAGTPDTADAVRFRMLETLREFGVERLAERDALRAARDAHAAHFRGFAEARDPLLRTARQVEALDALHAERENLAAAMRHAIDSGDADTAVRTAAAMSWSWLLTGAHYEGAQWLVAADDLPGEAPEAARAVISIMRQVFLLNMGVGADRPIEEMLAMLPPPGRYAHLTGHPILAMVDPLIAMLRGEHASTIAQLHSHSADDDPWTRAMIEVLVASTAENAGESELERRSYERGLAMFREIGDRWGIAACLSGLGRLQTQDGDYEAAVRTYRDSLATLEEIRSRDELVETLLRLAGTYAHLGRVEASEQTLARAVAATDAATRTIVDVIASMIRASVAWLSGDLDRAEGLLRASAARTETSLVRPPQLRAILQAMLATLLALTGRGTVEERAALVERALADASLMWDMPCLATAIVARSAHTLACGDAPEAALLLGAAHAVRGRDDKADVPLRRTRVAVAEALGEAAAQKFFAEGMALSRRDAILRVGLTPRD